MKGSKNHRDAHVDFIAPNRNAAVSWADTGLQHETVTNCDLPIAEDLDN